MKLVVKILFAFLCLLIVQATPSYARSHTSWDISVGVGGPYYYDPYYDPYYYPSYDPYYYHPAYVVAPEPVIVSRPVQEVVVTQPVQQVVAQPTAPVIDQDAFTINVPNNNGGYTSVVIKKSGNGYTGPQGEYYAEFPKVSQLKIMYGK